MPHNKNRMRILWLIATGCILLFLLYDMGSNWEYVLSNRFRKLSAMIVTGCAIAFSTVIFQTITHNRILTPSLLGLDSLYLLIQTALIFLLGSFSFTLLPVSVHFFLSIGLMILFSLFLFQVFLKKGTYIYFLLLMGLVFGTFFQSISSFMQMIIDPNEFQIVQDQMFASFHNIQVELIGFSLLVMLGVGVAIRRDLKFLDVLALGRDHAINLGVPYDQVVKRLFIMVAVLISVATALVGPITFLGLIVANAAYELVQTHRHRVVLPVAIWISIIALVGGQWVVEELFAFQTPISVIIHFVGGLYLLFLFVREGRS